MKIKELSIGDWVRNPTTGSHYKITATFLTPMGEMLTAQVDGEGKDIRCFSENIEPIPLTPEILGKNGFARKDKYRFVNTDILSIVEKYGNKYYDYHNIYKKGKTYRPIRVEADNIRYVHQLQHAMRLAGIEKEIEL